jgi:two-component system chemotaxis response regulator CheB
MDRVIRVLVVDDSAYVRKVIKQMLTRSPFLDVVGAAGTAEEALEMVERLKPDVVTLDLIMPGIGGIGFLRKQMERQPIPVVVVSISSESSRPVIEALDLGAVDFVQKPSALATEKVFEMSEELISKVKVASTIPMHRVAPVATSAGGAGKRSLGIPRLAVNVIVIGISTGGPQGLKQVIPGLPKDFPIPVVIVLHMPAGYTEMYAQSLAQLSKLRVAEAQDNEELRPGVLIAQAGRHTVLRKAGESVMTHLDSRPFDTLHRPSADVLFRSATEVFKDRVLGVVMTGMGEDGKDGAAWIKANGGIVFAEAEETCVVYGMPRAVVEAKLADRVIPLNEMAEAFLEVAYGENHGR